MTWARTGFLCAAALATATIIGACGSTGGSTGGNQTSANAGGGAGQATPGGGGQPAAGGSGSGMFTLAGLVSGQISGPYFDQSGEGKPCGKQANGAWFAMYNGALGGITITGSNYSGAGSFSSDANPGDWQFRFGGPGGTFDQGTSQTWTVTINADEKSGKLHADLKSTSSTSTATAEVVDGTFSC
jgi:hypothetical protein